MSPNDPDATPRKAGGLWARLFGVQKDSQSDEKKKQEANQENESKEAASPPPSQEGSEPPVAHRVETPVSETPAPPASDADTEGGGGLPGEVKSVFEAQGDDEASAFPDLNLDDSPEEVAEVAEAVAEEPLPEAEPALGVTPLPGPTEASTGPLDEMIPEVPEPPEDLVPTEPPSVEVPTAEVPTAEVPTAEVPIAEIPPEEVPPVVAEPVVEAAPVGPTPEGPVPCPACSAMVAEPTFCPDCGYMFTGNEGGSASSPAGMATVGSPVAATAHTVPQAPLQDRYQVGELIVQRAGLYYYRGTDLQDTSGTPTPVLVIAGPATSVRPSLPVGAIEPEELPQAEDTLDEFLPDFDSGALGEIVEGEASWPSIGWEKAVRDGADHPGIPQVLDHFVEGEFEYLIVDVVQGEVLWDAWSDPNTTYAMRYGWLMQIAAALHALHQCGAILEALQPDKVTVNESGQAILSDLTDLLPIPLPPNAPVRGSLYTAPELMISPDKVTGQADIYSFGAMLYALEYLGHHLQESDFEHQFSPKLITERYPDVHPAFNRLILKTFNRDQYMRFPTDEAAKTDPTGFTELIRTLGVCQKTFDRVRLDIAAWTTTGMIRTGNEDAFALLHASESREDELTEYALVLLADGMGGYEAGEVAAAMALKELRAKLLEHPIFSAVAGQGPPKDGTFDLETCKELLKEALRHANKTVYTASRAPGQGKRGMGCTAEAIYIDDKNVVVGHVGDSRTYHLTNGRLVQLTRDHTWVNRMVELGKLTPEEAEDHDRKNELQQAIGGQPDVTPEMYHAKLSRGDWVLVCSDGLMDKVPDADIVKMLMRETSGSAEDAAKRLLNLVNLRGATDNTTVVIVRAS